jgi:hypothetical protein
VSKRIGRFLDALSLRLAGNDFVETRTLEQELCRLQASQALVCNRNIRKILRRLMADIGRRLICQIDSREAWRSQALSRPQIHCAAEKRIYWPQLTSGKGDRLIRFTGHCTTNHVKRKCGHSP